MINKFNFMFFLANISFISFVSYNNYQLNNELNSLKKQLNVIEIDCKNLSSQINISKLDIINQVDSTITQTAFESTTSNGLYSLFTGVILICTFIYFFNINLSFADTISKNTISTVKGCAEVEIEAISKYSDVLQHVIHTDTKILDKKLDKLIDLSLTSSNINQNILKVIDPQTVTNTVIENSDTLLNVTSTITQL